VSKKKNLTKETIQLNELQPIQGEWQEIVLGEDATPATLVAKLDEELKEVVELTDGLTSEGFNDKCKNNPVFKESIGLEAADIIIVAAGLIDSLDLDTESLLWQKMRVNHSKYNSGRLQELMSKGLTRQEAIQHIKEEWNNNAR
jgi:NTP pyrophosphatase (non-canonical NTP hydrolase)